MKTGLNRCFSLYIITVFSLTLLISCKKNNDNAPGNGDGYYMKFKLNGTQIEYKGQAECNFNKVTNLQHAASFAGLKETLVAGKNNMSIILGTGDENKTGITYTCYATNTAGYEKAKVLNIVYIDENGKSYLSWSEEFAPALPVGTETKAQLNVTEATTAYLKGNFSGVLYNNDYSVKFSVTDGEFYLRRLN